ncbi:MAG: polysaccharide deacetylase family protein, partial [Gemmatimonadota bacterium]
PGLFGSEAFWWDRLSDRESRTVPAQVRARVFRQLGGRQEEALAWGRHSGLLGDPLPSLYAPASEEEVVAAGGMPGVTLGSHTWSHVHLPSVPLEEAREELRTSLEWLRRIGVRDLPYVSYPYGAASRSVMAIAVQAGYEGGLLVAGGPTSVGKLQSAPFENPRLNVPRGLSREGFAARVMGAWFR